MTIAGVDLRIEKIKVLQADTLHDRNAGASISRGYMVVLAALEALGVSVVVPVIKVLDGPAVVN